MSAPEDATKRPQTVSLADEEGVKQVLVGAVLGLWSGLSSPARELPNSTHLAKPDTREDDCPAGPADGDKVSSVKISSNELAPPAVGLSGNGNDRQGELAAPRVAAVVGPPGYAFLSEALAMPWTPSSWQQKRLDQPVVYPDERKLQATLECLARLPPLVTSWEVETLKRQLAEASRGERFLLQGGDCCEAFADCEAATIARKLKIILQMSVILLYGCRKRVILVGRYAGQYAKPRTTLDETRNGVTLPSYRGDLINRVGFTREDRVPDPALLLRGYQYAALTLNFIRALVQGGFADLHHPEYWDLDFVGHSPQASEYHSIMEKISDAIRFMETCVSIPAADLNRVDFFTSHEGLNLWYEQAQTRKVPRRVGWYDLSTHFPWIGDRTRSLDGAHVEYFRGLANPIAVKVGPSLQPDELLGLLAILNPDNEPGRLTLIHRFGTAGISHCLPPLVEAVRRAGKHVLWCCDPMHGNTLATTSGVKTRRFDDILGELDQAFSIHTEFGSTLGGVHFELTGENVTECVGGARGLTEADLKTAYKSQVDPRLNYEQAMEMALLLARRMRSASPGCHTSTHR
jgi:3-deoxy-7-phosphoheptulonate synthase